MRCRGFSLTELLVVIIIVGAVAAVTVPALRSDDPRKLDLAAARVAEAIRIARAEAIRTGAVHSVVIEHGSDDVSVDKTDLTTQPPTAELLLYHPVTKQPFDFNLATDRPTAGVIIANTQDSFDFTGLGARRRLMFTAQGIPFFFEPGTGVSHRLASGDVLLGQGSDQRTVSVDPYSGRVTIR